MFKVGSIVKYKKEWCSPGEERFLHRVLENRVNPVTGKMTRLLIECINMQNMSFNPTEDVEDCMVELAEEEE